MYNRNGYWNGSTCPSTLKLLLLLVLVLVVVAALVDVLLLADRRYLVRCRPASCPENGYHGEVEQEEDGGVDVHGPVVLVVQVELVEGGAVSRDDDVLQSKQSAEVETKRVGLIHCVLPAVISLALADVVWRSLGGPHLAHRLWGGNKAWASSVWYRYRHSIWPALKKPTNTQSALKPR